jgi:hypothetical protein
MTMNIRKAIYSDFVMVAHGAKFVGWYIGHPAYYIAVKGVKVIPHMRGPRVLGFCLMVGGVMIAKSGHHMPNVLLEYGADLVGYAVHGAGAMPWLLSFEKYFKKELEQFEA